MLGLVVYLFYIFLITFLKCIDLSTSYNSKEPLSQSINLCFGITVNPNRFEKLNYQNSNSGQ